MFLCDRHIRALSSKKDKPLISPFVEKLVEKGVVSYGLSSFGYDMRAGLQWHIFQQRPEVLHGLGQPVIIDPKKVSNDHYQEVVVQQGEAVLIPPNSYALTHSFERVCMPDDLFAICVGKSTYARVGIHVNVTPLEPGWEGEITIEISNATPLPVKVYAGEGIMQVIFAQGALPERSYRARAGKYQNQQGIVHARVKSDTDDLPP